MYDRSITSLSRDGAAGDLVVVFDDRRRFAAIGLFDPDSPIRIKVVHHRTPATIDREWWRARLQVAIEQRASVLGDGQTTACRLVNGESDGFPGLVADRYADTLVVKIYSAAWAPHLDVVLSELLDAAGVERLVLRTARSVTIDGIVDGQIVAGPELADDEVWFAEHGVRLLAHPLHGQKTGFFIDQRDNRRRVSELVSGVTALDVFSCTGGFSAAAAVGGAASVTSVDLAPAAIETAGRVMAENAPSVEWDGIVGDAFDVLQRLRRRGRTFGLVVVDPPSFAQRQASVAGAVKAYRKLTELAVPLVEPGGLLMQASCSSRVGADEFFETVTGTIRQTGRSFEEIERTGHAVDHPATFPEAQYLKAMFARLG